MTAPTLLTKRLILRQLTLDDAEALHQALADAQLMKWWSSGPHRSVDETRTYLQWNAAIDQGHYCWAITSDTVTALGWVILFPRRCGVFEIGYILRRSQWGRGLASEAVAAAIGFGFRSLNLRRIMADVDPDNQPSIRLLERLGFTCEGRLRGEWETHIGIRDSLIFGLLADEWHDP